MYLLSNKILLLKMVYCLVNNIIEGFLLKILILVIVMRYLNVFIYFRKFDNKMFLKNYIVKI